MMQSGRSALKRYGDLGILAIGVALALALRYALRDFETYDYVTFTGPWYDIIKEQGGFQAMRLDFYDYTPPYLWLITFATYVLAGVPKVFALKLISILFDFLCAFFVYKLVRLKYAHRAIPLLAFFAVLFAPTVVLNSSMWGQADAIYTTGLVACLYFILTKRQAPAFIAFGLAFAFKLQALFLAPFLVALWLKGNVSWKGFLLIPAMYLVGILPTWLMGRPLPDLLTIYLKQADRYQSLTKSAPNVYQWMNDKFYATLYPAGIIFALAVALLFCFVVYKSRARLTPALTVQLATFSVLVMPFVIPKMHDRYFFPADVLTIVFAFFFPRYFWVPVVVGLASFFSYAPFLLEVEVIPLSLVALALLGVILILARKLVISLDLDWSVAGE